MVNLGQGFRVRGGGYGQILPLSEEIAQGVLEPGWQRWHSMQRRLKGEGVISNQILAFSLQEKRFSISPNHPTYRVLDC